MVLMPDTPCLNMHSSLHNTLRRLDLRRPPPLPVINGLQGSLPDMDDEGVTCLVQVGLQTLYLLAVHR